MALDEEQSLAAAGLRDAAGCLGGCDALAGVDAGALRILGAGAVHFSLPAGATRCAAGTAADGAYLGGNGSLGVKTPGDPVVRARIEAAELVGELGWLLGEPRGAQVIAMRDSELLKFDCRVLDEAAARSPSFSLAIARLCARRLAQGGRRRAAVRARSFAIVPNGVATDAGHFAALLVAELAARERADQPMVQSDRGVQRLRGVSRRSAGHRLDAPMLPPGRCPAARGGRRRRAAGLAGGGGRDGRAVPHAG